MGDRSNIKITYPSGESIYFYGHWMGARNIEIARDVLSTSGDRAGDPEYLARMVFSRMVRDDIDGSTGYGISPTLMDNENKVAHIQYAHEKWGWAPALKLEEEDGDLIMEVVY